MQNQPVHVKALAALALFFFLAYWVDGIMVARHFIAASIVGQAAMDWFGRFMFGAAVCLIPSGVGNPGSKP